jgi:hypothetical protein
MLSNVAVVETENSVDDWIDDEEAAGPGRPLLELRVRECRFAVTPEGSTRHRFCGEAVAGAGSWCPDHRKIVFTPPPPVMVRR